MDEKSVRHASLLAIAFATIVIFLLFWLYAASVEFGFMSVIGFIDLPLVGIVVYSYAIPIVAAFVLTGLMIMLSAFFKASFHFLCVLEVVFVAALVFCAIYITDNMIWTVVLALASVCLLAPPVLYYRTRIINRKRRITGVS